MPLHLEVAFATQNLVHNPDQGRDTLNSFGVWLHSGLQVQQLVRFSPPEQIGTTLTLQALKPQVILAWTSRATSNTITTAPERPHRQERLFTSYYFMLHECTNTHTNFSSFGLQAASQSTFVLRNNFSLCQLVRVLCGLSLALKPRVQSKCSGSRLTEQSYSFSIPWQAQSRKASFPFTPVKQNYSLKFHPSPNCWTSPFKTCL